MCFVLLGKKFFFLKAVEHPNCSSLINMTSTTVEPGNMTTAVEQIILEHLSSAKPVNSPTDIGSGSTTVSRSVTTKPCKDASRVNQLREKRSHTLHIASLAYPNVTTLLLGIRINLCCNAFYSRTGVFRAPAFSVIGCLVFRSCVTTITSTIMSSINFVKMLITTQLQMSLIICKVQLVSLEFQS